MTYNVFSGTLNPTHSLTLTVSLGTYSASRPVGGFEGAAVRQGTGMERGGDEQSKGIRGRRGIYTKRQKITRHRASTSTCCVLADISRSALCCQQ